MQASAARKLTLRIVGAAGAILFASFFALTYHTPRWVEDFWFNNARVTARILEGLASAVGSAIPS